MEWGFSLAFPLRVPLHRQQEGEGGGVDRLGQPVFGMEPGGQPLATS